MISIAAVAISVLFAIAITLASPEKFADNLKRSRILTPVLCVDVVFMAANLILTAMSLQLIPTVKCIAAMVLTVVTVFTALIGMTRRKGAFILASVFTLVFVTVGALFFPKYHGIKEIEGEKYAGITMALDLFDDWKCIYYYKIKFPLVISDYYDVVEDHGVGYPCD